MSTECSNNTSALTLSPCVSLTFLLNVGIELTANQYQSKPMSESGGVVGRGAISERLTQSPVKESKKKEVARPGGSEQ